MVNAKAAVQCNTHHLEITGHNGRGHATIHVDVARWISGLLLTGSFGMAEQNDTRADRSVIMRVRMFMRASTDPKGMSGPDVIFMSCEPGVAG